MTQLQLPCRSACTPAAAGLPPSLGVLLLGAVYLLPLLATVRGVTDSDTWWHLRAGQWIVEQRTIPDTDPFAQGGAHRPWIAYSWLYEVVLYAAHLALGLRGVVLCRVLLVLLAALSLHRLIGRREPRFLVAAVLTGVCLLALVPLMTERPWLLSILFSVWTVQAVLDLRDEPAHWTTWLLPVAYAVWANTHIQFVYGLLILAAGCVAPLLERLAGVPAAPDARARWLRLVGLSGLCLLLTLANPYHVALYGAAWDCAALRAAPELIRELTAMPFRQVWDWLILALALAGAFRLGRRPALPGFEVLLLVLAAYFAFHARRDVWLMVLAAAVVLPGATASAAGCPLARRHGAALAALLLGLGGLIALGRGLSEDGLREIEAAAYPRRATEWLARQGETGRLFNSFNWGGYLMWRLPQLPVSIDGRAHIYSDAEVQRTHDTWEALPHWQEDPDLRRADVIVAQHATPLAALLREQPGWRLEYEDEIASVYRRER